MPVRRASASAGHVSSSSNAIASSSRAHKSNDSYHGFTGQPGQSSHTGLYGSGNGLSATPQQKIVHVLINRLKNKLPCNSGISLDAIEADAALQQAVECLVDLARDSLDIIAWALAELLDKLAKQTDANGHVSVEILQSQLFILKVLAGAMASRWYQYVDHPRSSSRSSKPSGRAGSINNVPSLPTSPVPSGSMRQGLNMSSDHLSTSPPYTEPLPLDDNCARYILSVMVLFLRQTAPSEVHLTSSANLHFDSSSSAYDLESIDRLSSPSVETWFEGALPNADGSHNTIRSQTSFSSMGSGGSGTPKTPSPIPLPPHSMIFERTPPSLCQSSSQLNNLIAKFAGRTVYHLSASNWAVVFHRIRNKIRHLASSTEENPDIIDLHLMTHSALDKTRLIQILQELSSLLLNMRREAQAAVSVPLRAAVWKWIDVFPEEFNDAVRSARRMEGAPERVFDLLYERNDSDNRRLLWPALAVLMCISSERLKSDYQTNFASYPHMAASSKIGHKKENHFVEQVVRNIGTWSRISEVALVCALDVCRAAIRVRPDGEISLLSIANDLVHEIKSLILSHGGTRPFWDADEEIDVPLFTDILVTMYRFLPEEEAVGLFAVCLDPERADAVKMCAIKAALALTLEAPKLPWQPSLAALEAVVAPRTRGIFRCIASRQPEVDGNGIIKRTAPRPKSKRVSSEPLSDRELLVLGICSLWQANYKYYFVGMPKLDSPEWVPNSIKVWDSSMDYSVKQSAAWAIRYLGQLVFRLRPEDDYFYEVISWMRLSAPSTLISTSANLLNARTNLKAQRIWIDLAYELLLVFTRATDQKELKELQLDHTRVAAFAMAEIAFLVSLSSVDTKVSSLSAQCLRLIAQAERQPDAPMNPGMNEEMRAKRHRTYDQLGDPKVVILGRVGHQKRIRKLLRSMAYPMPCHIAVWEECYWRWVTMTEFTTRTMEGELGDPNGHTPVAYMMMTYEERQYQWQNLTLFLSAFGAACSVDSADEHDGSCLTDYIPMKYLPDNMRVLRDPAELMGSFITQLIDFLLSDSIQIRDNARDALGSELSPRLHSRLIKHLDELSAPTVTSSVLANQFDRVIQDVTQSGTGEWVEHFAIFLDQFIAVLKLLIENVEAPGEELMGIDINSTLLALASFIARFPDPASYRTRIKFCALSDSVYERMEIMALHKDSSTSHGLLDVVIEWIQDPSQISDPDAIRIQQEVNTASLRTAVRLMDRLKLSITDSSAGDNPGHAASRLFKHYYDILLKALDFNRSDRPMHDDGLSEKSSLSQRGRSYQKDVELRELVITGLANLIASNTESSFKTCIPLAYHKDLRKRSVFAHVFSRVLGQGTKFEFDSNSAVTLRTSRLCELVKGSEVLAVAICETCPSTDVDVIIPVLFNLFDTRASLMSLLKTLIDREIAHTENESGLFRSNNTTARLLSTFARVHGYNYLRSLIIPLIKSMTAMPPGHSYELDPAKAGDQDVKQNQENVELITTSFLEIISSSVPAFPPMFREVCAHLAKAVQDVWPEAKFKALGSFIFLRFISPAIVAPDTIDIELPKDASGLIIRRGLMVVAKIIQNLANNIFFGKEAHMEVLNDFLRDNIVNVTRYLSEVNKYSAAGTDEDPNEWLGSTYDDTDTIVLHRFFEKHGDKVGKDLLSLAKPSSEGDASAINGKRAWNALCSALVDLGQALEVPRPSPLNSSEHRDYISLMTRYSLRSVDAVRDLVLETSIPKDQPAVFVCRMSKIDVEALDIELLMYHVFKIFALPEYQSRLFEVILDCTSFTSASEIPVQWVKYCAELTPSDVRQRCIAVHILNPNSLAQRYLRRVYNISAGMSFLSDVRVHTSVAELLEHVPETVISALVYPTSLEQESYEEYREVTMRHSQQMRVPVVLSVGASHLRIMSLKAQPISSGLSCKTTEIILLAEVSDVYNVSTGHEQFEFIIRRNRHGLILYFASPARDAIVKAIRQAKGQMRNVFLPGSERFSRLSNVSATLLHIGFFSVGYEDEELRYAAYDLLATLCSYLDYDGNPAVSTKAGFIPAHPSTFVIQLSERLAAHAPQLTLDFFTEVANGMEKARENKLGMSDTGTAQRIYCLKYMSPWVKNLSHFCNPISAYYEPSGTRLRDCIVLLVDLTIADHELELNFHQYIWAEIGKLDSSVISIVLDELMRMATDGGVESGRCEIVTSILSALSSLPVRGKILSRLRKILGKASSNPPQNLVDNTFWNEIACLTRLALVVGAPSKQAVHNQFYVPEMIHLVTLIAGTGQTLVRTSVYGIVMNLLHALYLACSEDAAASSRVRMLLDECTQKEILELFGLVRASPSSEYTNFDPSGDRSFIDRSERLTQLLVRIVEASATSQGLLNVWRARWMSLVVSTAFQYSSPIQSRSFIVLGVLATSDVDDDLLYQMLVAFKAALSRANELDSTAVVSMLRCICKVVPSLSGNSRYLCQLFWLAVALLQSSHMALYADAADMLKATLEKLENAGVLKEKGVPMTLLDARSPLHDVASQLDETLQLSFDSNFSFALASTIFKGVRHSGLKSSATAVLRSLLRVTVRTSGSEQVDGAIDTSSLCLDALGYFLALIPFSTTPETYRTLLDDCDADPFWRPDEDGGVVVDTNTPRIPFDFLGITDSNTALLTTSFVGAMLTTAQGDDVETEMFYNLLSDIANMFPEIIQLAFESLQDRIKETFAHSSNPAILSAVSNVFRVAMQDPSRSGPLKGSASSLITVEEVSRGPGQKHLDALEDVKMKGLPNTFQFLPAGRHGTRMMNWIPELVVKIIHYEE